MTGSGNLAAWVVPAERTIYASARNQDGASGEQEGRQYGTILGLWLMAF